MVMDVNPPSGEHPRYIGDLHRGSAEPDCKKRFGLRAPARRNWAKEGRTSILCEDLKRALARPSRAATRKWPFGRGVCNANVEELVRRHAGILSLCSGTILRKDRE